MNEITNFYFVVRPSFAQEHINDLEIFPSEAGGGQNEAKRRLNIGLTLL